MKYWRGARKRMFRQLVEQLIESGDWGSAPISEANRWLITGPDTMASLHRRRLHRLLDFHKFSRQGTLEPKHTRAFWLAIPELEYFANYWMKQTYHVGLIVQACYEDHPLLAVLPKRSHFGGAA